MENLNEIMKSLQYFWQETKDIERWTGFEENKELIKEKYPVVYDAWMRYKSAKETMSIVCRNLDEEIDWDL
jgi:hypothetical protein